MADEESPWDDLLRELFGEGADDAIEEMRRMGFDPESLTADSEIGRMPGMVEHLLAQLRALMEQSKGRNVNWALAHDVARGVAAQGGDPSVSSATATTYRDAVTVAELWLDAVTDLPPSALPPHVWSHAEWVEATLPTWRRLAGPVAVSVSRALASLIGDEARGENPILENISATVCGMHMGQAAGALAREAFGGADLGIPLLPEPRVALIPRSIDAFAAGFENLPPEEARLFLTLRECAHVRLFLRAPWLAGQLHIEIERYAKGVAIDPEALDRAVRDASKVSPAQLQRSLSRGIFASSHTDDQLATLERIETILALIEGWVEHVTAEAARPHLPRVAELQEMMRRRRAAGGPAEHTFATLLGLDLRPRRSRDAAWLWNYVESEVGVEARDGIWSHPDLLPTAAEFDNPARWLAGRLAAGVDDAVDRELKELLDDGSGGAGDDNTGARA